MPVPVSLPVVYKFVACAMSVFAGVFVLTVGAAKVERMCGGYVFLESGA